MDDSTTTASFMAARCSELFGYFENPSIHAHNARQQLRDTGILPIEHQ
jgi:hypothetical protein